MNIDSSDDGKVVIVVVKVVTKQSVTKMSSVDYQLTCS